MECHDICNTTWLCNRCKLYGNQPITSCSYFFLTGSSLLDCISSVFLFISIFHHLLHLHSNSVFLIISLLSSTCLLLMLYTVFRLLTFSDSTVVSAERFLFLSIHKVVIWYFTNIFMVFCASHYGIWEVYCICKCDRSTHICNFLSRN